MDYISFLLIIFLIPLTFSSPLPLKQPFSKIYAFGDSFTDTGNTRSTTGPYAFGSVSRPPYGTTFFHHPTNRYSDGRLVIDFLATTLSLPFLPPYLNQSSQSSSHGVNFAVAGSTALDHEVFVEHNITLDITPQSLGTQLEWFNNYFEKKGCRRAGSTECRLALQGALFWVGEIGVNDYAYSFGSSLSLKFIQQQAVQNVISFLQELRRHYPNAIIAYADYLRAHRTIIENSKANGFVEPFKACCGAGGGQYNFDIFNTCGSPEASRACSDPSKYVNWDGVHLTEAVYKKVADMFFYGGYCQPSFDIFLRNKEN